MILTEEEAKTKRCPESIMESSGRIHMNCLGSACMAWRWNGIRIGGEPGAGYCGKAGAP